MQPTADQQTSHLIGCTSTIHKYGIAFLDQSNGSGGDGLLFLPCFRLPVIEMGQLGRTARVKHTAVDPLSQALLLQLGQIAPNGGFRYRKLLDQFWQRGKSPGADQF